MLDEVITDVAGRRPGDRADAVLLLNIVFIVAGLALFGATLTLPGIAGIILTIGMAVDRITSYNVCYTKLLRVASSRARLWKSQKSQRTDTGV